MGDARFHGPLHIALQHGVVKPVAEMPPNEKTAEALEEPLQGPDPGPLPHSVGDGHPVGQQEGHQEIVGVAAVVHDVHHRGMARDAVELGLGAAADANAVEGAQQHRRGLLSETISGEQIEIRDDLIQIIRHAHPGLGFF